jgi:hypothetical protein
MPILGKSPNTPGSNAQKYFKKADASETPAKKIRKTERATDAAKMAKLRTLRLAKETTDKQEADKRTAEQSPGTAKPSRRKATATVKPPKMMRLVY